LIDIIKQSLKHFICAVIVKSGVLALLVSRRRANLAVLMFHRIDTVEDNLGLCISPDFFEAQLKYLADCYNVIPMSEAIEKLASGNLARNSVVITFDDGWRDNYINAFPLLKKYKIPATVFVTYEAIEQGTFGWCSFDKAILNSCHTELDLSFFGLGTFSLNDQEQKESLISFLHQKLKRLDNSTTLAVIEHVTNELGGVDGERVMLSWQEIKEMQASNLITIGAHTVTHPILTQISQPQAKYEIEEGKRLIEDKTGTIIDFFAYPNGSSNDFNSEIIGMVEKSGYKSAFSTIPGVNRDFSYRYLLRRMDVTYGMCKGIGDRFSQSMFDVKISGIFQGILFKS